MNHTPTRKRKLLLHRSEIEKPRAETREKGLTKRRDSGCVAAADFSTIEVWILKGYLVFFVIELSTRRIRMAGIAHSQTHLG